MKKRFKEKSSVRKEKLIQRERFSEKKKVIQRKDFCEKG